MTFDSGLPTPQIQQDTDVVVKVLKTTICGTDLHILSGNVLTCDAPQRLGHEGIGEVVAAGSAVKNRKVGDRILVSCITGCGNCPKCAKDFMGHCEDGGWVLGNTIGGMQGQYARVPHADHATWVIPPELHDTKTEDSLVMCSDILPTGLEVGLIDGKAKEGDSIAIIGVGPVGMATLLCCGLYKPKEIFVIDNNEHRLDVCKELGKANGLENIPMHIINNSNNDAIEQVLNMTDKQGVDLAIEAIGIPVGWYICQDIVKAGGNIAMLGVHGKPATINLERMWWRNFSFTAGLVHGYTTTRLFNMIVNGELDPSSLITHRMKMSDLETAYKQFKDAGEHKAIKILLENDM